MGRLKNMLRRVTRAPGVPTARHLTERAVAPYLREDLYSLHQGLLDTVRRLEVQEQHLAAEVLHNTATRDAVTDIERHMPSVLNAIASTNGTTRLLRREFELVRDDIAGLRAHVGNLVSVPDFQRSVQDRIQADQSVRDDFGVHIDTLKWLMQRVELIRAEVMNEIRYGGGASAGAPGDVDVVTEIVNAAALDPADGVVRLNLGAGHIPLDGFANVDMRPLPGIDVVAAIDALPVEPASVDEIFSAHTLEHFPEEQLRRTLLPYWFGLLKPGGTFRAVVPDLEAMTKAYADGELTFENLRQVTYGGQEYEGDFHFTGFTPTSMGELLQSAGFAEPRVIASGRRNGDCLECEVSAKRPAG